MSGPRSSTVIEPRGFRAFELKRGDVMRVEDVSGTQCADIAFFDAASYAAAVAQVTPDALIPQSMIEHYSQPTTVSTNRHVYLGKGHALYTNHANRIMTIVEDQVGHHDVVSSFCNPETNRARWGERAEGKRTCKENIRDALLPYRIDVDMPCTFNIFMDFAIGADGAIHWGESLSRPGEYIDMRAETDVIVALSNCPMEINAVNGFNPSELRLTIFDLDEYRSISPESADLEPLAVPN